MFDGYEPHGTIVQPAPPRALPAGRARLAWWGRGVPGVVGTRWAWRGAIPGTHPDQSQDPIFSIFKAQGPTYGQMKAILEVSLRFPRIDLRIDPELT